ncbi:hypothetical protein CGLO_14645 [Colletotrichum gloeosporioides Cg-14]|uniref:Uncharacterized protein n=1 Tax=Colletotrichum gloeosporioides (strain Cg-14) TaxID=1237896 RepID=T0L3T4_COLGC|nr:hypothetical protein CGLO_14645 [Colletotrichum gloeosporioides Cg-14]
MSSHYFHYVLLYQSQ